MILEYIVGGQNSHSKNILFGLAVWAGLFFFGAVPALAQSCSTAGAVQRGGGQILICDGSDWQVATEIENTGRQYLQFANDAGSCDATKTGRIRYDESGDVWEYCDGTGPCWKPMIGELNETPDAFAFTDQTDVATSTQIFSNTETITGITCSASASISGDGSPEFSVNGGSWVTSSSISNNDDVQLRLNSSASEGTPHTATMTIGDVSDEWNVTTLVTCDNTPDAFSFTDETGAEPSTVITSNTIQVTGFDCNNVSVSISGDGSPEFSVNGGSWVTSGTINSGDDLQLRLTSSASYETTHSATVTVGTESDQWNVTTRSECDTTPTEYSTPGTYSYAVPTGCTSVTIEAYGAGGGGGGFSGGGGGGGGSVVERTDSTLLVVGGGGGGGGAGSGGGGGYGEATASVIGGSENLNVWVGGGGSSGGFGGGGNGGAVDGGAGSDNTNAEGSTYGGGGGVGSASAGNSTYGGGGGSTNGDGGNSYYGGGGGTDNGDRGTSTVGENGQTYGGGGGGGGYGDTVINGATAGAAANDGPGDGSTGTGGDGKVVITPAA